MATTIETPGHVAAVIDLLQTNLDSLIRQRSEIDQSIGRHQQALAVLRGSNIDGDRES